MTMTRELCDVCFGDGRLTWQDEEERIPYDEPPVCVRCNGTGYLPQPKELDRWYGRQRCSCHADYNAETERLRAYP